MRQRRKRGENQEDLEYWKQKERIFHKEVIQDETWSLDWVIGTQW